MRGTEAPFSAHLPFVLHVRRTAWRPTHVVEQTKTEASQGGVPVIPELAKHLESHREGFPYSSRRGCPIFAPVKINPSELASNTLITVDILIGRGGGDRNDRQTNKACALYALQPPPLPNWNKRNNRHAQPSQVRRALDAESQQQLSV